VGARPERRFNPALAEHMSFYVTLRLDWKSSGFFRLSSVREKLRIAAWLRLGASRSGGGKAEGAPPFRQLLSWAVPCPLLFPCLSERDEWPTTPVFGVLGTSNTRIFRYSLLGNVPTRAEAFPWRYSCTLLHFLKPYNRWCRAFVAAHSLVHLEQHGRVFTASPAPANPYTIQLERYY
jgi:hypothetical protein